MQHRGGICGLAVPQCRLKTNLLGSTYRGIVQTMAQPPDDTQDAEPTGRFEDYLQQYFPFDAQLFAFFTIDRRWFRNDFSGYHPGSSLRRFRPNLVRGRGLGIAESALPH